MNKENVLIVVAGPSGVGKGTVCAKLMEDMDTIDFSVSATTRKARTGEEEGVNYFFVSHNKFDNMIDNDEFLEYANVYDNKYGTPKEYVLSKLNSGKDVLLEIDMQGAMMVMDTYKSAVFIFIAPPSVEILESRLINRATDSNEQIALRLSKAQHEIQHAEKFDYIVVNDDIRKAANEIMSIIIGEKCSTDRNKRIIDKLLST